MNVGLDNHRVQVSARVEEANAVILDFESTADFSEDVQESCHFLLTCTANKNVALGCKRCRCPRCCLVAVEQCAVFVTTETLHALDANHAVGVNRDDCAHLLQDRDEIHDLWLDCCARQFG